MRYFISTVFLIVFLSVPIAGLTQERITEVEFSMVKELNKIEEILAVGTLFPFNDIVIKPEISGKVVSINIEEGKSIEKGALLIRFDDRIQQANVKETHAKQQLAKQNDSRFTAAKAGSTAQMKDEAKALVLQTEAAHEAAQAELDKMTLIAPFSGVVGLKNIDLGDYVQVGTSLVTLSNIDQLKLEFNIPERVAHVARVGQRVEFTIDNFPNETFEAEVYAISPEIELEGRSLAIRALYQNDDHRLLPGMFSRLALKIPLGYSVIVVPEEAVFASEGQHYVYRVVKNEGEENFRALLTEVELGDRTSFSVEVLKGLTVDDLVVKVGQLRIRDGVQIKATEEEE